MWSAGWRCWPPILRCGCWVSIPAVAVAATCLPEPFHADPADHFLVALAHLVGTPLLSADNQILSYGHVRSLW